MYIYTYFFKFSSYIYFGLKIEADELMSFGNPFFVGCFSCYRTCPLLNNNFQPTETLKSFVSCSNSVKDGNIHNFSSTHDLAFKFCTMVINKCYLYFYK